MHLVLLVPEVQNVHHTMSECNTSVKIAAILQHNSCDHYTFATRIQFKAQAGEKEVMKQQVLILFASKSNDGQSCIANLYNLKLNQELGRPQLVFQQQLQDFDGTITTEEQRAEIGRLKARLEELRSGATLTRPVSRERLEPLQ